MPIISERLAESELITVADQPPNEVKKVDFLAGLIAGSWYARNSVKNFFLELPSPSFLENDPSISPFFLQL